MKTRSITINVNGVAHSLNVAVNRTLLQVLRDDLKMPETKYGCGTGECGACTVILDGKKSILSCLTLAATMDGANITTVAGLEKDGKLNPVQEAFVNQHAIQCGYCTPGMVMKSVTILAKNPKPTEEEIRRELEGNICRCTGYVKIVEAIQKASEVMAST
ncbi:MAG: (2Fe-2S)-binding protein [Deltaproteobacteria bacterium]|jgi:carbon-monoxide dehydrogenase small subunit|nr:(2Fe-2S)-binding protein [Deltaproteobacteria bacterium]